MLIGWASVDITPYGRKVNLMGLFHTRVMDKVHDPITATALALDGADGRGGRDCALMLSVDVCVVTAKFQDRLRSLVGKQLPDFDVRKLFLSATHTHTAPHTEEFWYPPLPGDVMSPVEYADFLAKKLTACAAAAWNNRREGSVAWAFGEAVVGHNRRALYRDGHAEMFGRADRPEFVSLEGGEDHSLNLLFTYDARKELTGVVLNLACPCQIAHCEDYISADFWHEVRAELRGKYGDGLGVLPTCAPAGDQCPQPLLSGREEAYMRQRLGLSERELVARKIAGAVGEALPTARNSAVDQPVLRHAVEMVGLPRYKAGENEIEREYRKAAGPDDGPGPEDPLEASRRHAFRVRRRWALEREELARTQPDLPVELHAVRLGEIVVATNPFELFLDFGVRIRARSCAIHTFLVQLTGDYADYLPTERAVAGGSYGATVLSCQVGPEGGRILVEKTVEMISRLWEP